MILAWVPSRAAQHAAVADAAARRQDPSHFRVRSLLNGFPLYRCGAAKRHTVGPLGHGSAYRTTGIDEGAYGRAIIQVSRDIIIP